MEITDLHCEHFDKFGNQLVNFFHPWDQMTTSLSIPLFKLLTTSQDYNNTNKTQQNKRCGDRDETIDYIISDYSKLAQKEYNTRQDCEGVVIHSEL